MADNIKDELASMLVKKADDYKSHKSALTERAIDIYYDYIGKVRNEDFDIQKRIPKGKDWRTKIYPKFLKTKALAAWSQSIQSIMSNPNMIEVSAKDETDTESVNNAPRMRDEMNSQFVGMDFSEKLKVGFLEKILYGSMFMEAPVMLSNKIKKVSLDTMGTLRNILTGTMSKSYKVSVEDKESPNVLNRNWFEMFPSPYASDLQSGEGVVHRAFISEYELNDLMNVSGFDKKAIKAVLTEGKTTSTDYDTLQQRTQARNASNASREGFDLITYHGKLLLKDLVKFDPSYSKDSSQKTGYIEVKAWVVANGSGGHILKLTKNLDVAGTRPLYSSVYERVPYELLGVGIGENIHDMSKLIRGAFNLFVDAKKLALPMIAINSQKKIPGMTLQFSPFKVWEFNGNPSEAIADFSFKDISNGLIPLIEIAERYADEITGIPKWTTGQDSKMLNKMLDIHTPIPLANGTVKKLRDIKDNDKIIGSNGKPTRVIKAHFIQLPKKAYEIKFQNGDVITAGGEHLWTARLGVNRKNKTQTLDTDTLYVKFKKNNNVFIPTINRPDFISNPILPIDPYLLGLWLGDGHSYGARFTVSDEGIMDYLSLWATNNYSHVVKDKQQKCGKATSVSIVSDIKNITNKFGQYSSNNSLISQLKRLQLCKKTNKDKGKHIPEVYFLASYEDRLNLLRGLMDTDGCHHSRSLVIFTQKEGRLLKDVERLVMSLGGVPKLNEQKGLKWGKENTKYYHMNFSLRDNPFKYSHKARKWKPQSYNVEAQRIVSMEEVKIRPMRCLTVDAHDGLFAVGEHFTLTHNTATGISMLMNASSQLMRGAIVNLDDYIVEPIATEMYYWNLEHNPRKDIKGIYNISASGLSTLMQKETLNQQLMGLLSFVVNPAVLQNPYALKLLRIVGDNMGIKNVDSVLPKPEELEKSAFMQLQQVKQMLGGVSSPDGGQGGGMGRMEGGVPLQQGGGM